MTSKRIFLTLALYLFVTILIPAYGKNLHWNKGRTYKPFQFATEEGIRIKNPTDTLIYDYLKLDNPTEIFSLEFRAKNINGNPSKRYQFINKDGNSVSINNPHWGFFITCVKDTLAIIVKGGEISTALEPVPSLDITVQNITSDLIKSVSLTDKINPYDGENLWSISMNGDNIIFSVGNKDLQQVLSFPCKSEVTGFGFYAGWGDSVIISDINAVIETPEETVTSGSIDSFEDRLTERNDPMEGYWTLFDRDLEESLIKLGGSYILGCIKEGEKLIFFYIYGALVNSKSWHKGDIKAVFTPSPFQGIYDVDWIDAMKQHFNNDVKAQEGEGNTLVIQFPYQSSKLRLRKIPD